MNKEELLKLLREANITSADLAEIETELPYVNVSTNTTRYECHDCKIKFASSTKKRKCPSCKSKNITLEVEEIVELEEKKEEKPYIHKTGINLNKNSSKGNINTSNNEESDKKFTKIEQINLKKLKKIEKVDSGVRLQSDQDFDSKVKFNKTPRDRSQFKLIKIRCNGPCGSIKEVNPAYIQGRSKDVWECDECLLSKKSQR